MSGRARPAGAAGFVVVLAAVVLCAATAASWVDQPVTRTVGDAAIREIRATAGTQLAPLGLVAGLAALLCGLALFVTRGDARRVVALLSVGAGVGAIVVIASGIIRAMARDGHLTVAPWLAAVASVAALAGGLLGFGRPRRRMPTRYDVDVQPADTEWQLAAEESDSAPEHGANDAASYPEAGS